MTKKSRNIKKEFLYPIGKYHGKFSPEKLVFDANLQQFSQQVSYFCGLEANGKISPQDTYDEIKKFWKQLKHSKKELLDNTNLTADE